MVGVGDGPWDAMRTLHEGTDARSFDNFCFVNYSQLQQQATGLPQASIDTQFAEEVLQDVPSHLKVGHKTVGAPIITVEMCIYTCG